MIVSCQVLAIMSLAGGVAAQPNAGQAREMRATEQLTPVVASVFSVPRWFLGDDDKVHVVYELFLTNALRVPATVTRLEVLDGVTGKIVRSLTNDELNAAMSLLAVGDSPKTELGPSEVGAIWLDLEFPNASTVPATFTHRLTVKIPPGLPIPETVTSTIPQLKVDLQPPVVLGPPLAGDQWVAVGSCCDGPHRRALQPVDGKLYLSQRFAIDFNRLDSANRFSSGDPALVTSYPTYGLPVLAVADATVVAAVDAYPDQVPGKATGITLANADGNHVVLDIGGGRFAFYAHLKPGSVRVRRGDSVTQGQQIGEAGNSGSSDGPHLHFHVMNGPSVLASDGMPYVFSDFILTGRIPPLDKSLKYYEAQEPVPIDRNGKGERQSQLPLSGAVVSFPDSSKR
jgi:hypothetical protein